MFLAITVCGGGARLALLGTLPDAVGRQASAREQHGEHGADAHEGASRHLGSVGDEEAAGEDEDGDEDADDHRDVGVDGEQDPRHQEHEAADDGEGDEGDRPRQKVHEPAPVFAGEDGGDGDDGDEAEHDPDERERDAVERADRQKGNGGGARQRRPRRRRQRRESHRANDGRAVLDGVQLGKELVAIGENGEDAGGDGGDRQPAQEDEAGALVAEDEIEQAQQRSQSRRTQEDHGRVVQERGPGRQGRGRRSQGCRKRTA
jgi:hypothetical protein